MKAPDNEPINISLLFEHSPLYRKLLKQHKVESLDPKEDLPSLFVLNDTISAEDALRTIEFFDFNKNYLNKKMIFFENTSDNKWNVVVKNKADYELNTTKSFTTSKKLQDTNAYNCLESNEIQGILEENKWVSAVKFKQPLEQCFENNKKHEFHVRTLFCNYLSKNLGGHNNLANLDLNNLILEDFGTGVNKLKFNKSDKFDFKYLFPVDEKDSSKVKTFYCDREGGGEQMISKVVKILDKYFKDLEEGKDIQGKDIETFIIVERAINQIIQVQLKSKAEEYRKNHNKENNNENILRNSNSRFEEKDCLKMREFEIKCSDLREKNGNFRNKLENRGSRSPDNMILQGSEKNNDGNFFESVEGFLKNLLGNPSNSTNKNVEQKEGEKTKYRKAVHEEDDKKPSNFLEGIIDAISFCCGSRNDKGGGR